MKTKPQGMQPAQRHSDGKPNWLLTPAEVGAQIRAKAEYQRVRSRARYQKLRGQRVPSLDADDFLTEDT